MSAFNDGGPAFPLATTPDTVDYHGMSLRDWFAGQAFSQAVDDYGQPEMMKSTGQRRDRGAPVLPYATAEMAREMIIARHAYRYADAMLKAREVSA